MWEAVEDWAKFIMSQFRVGGPSKRKVLKQALKNKQSNDPSLVIHWDTLWGQAEKLFVTSSYRQDSLGIMQSVKHKAW